MTDIKKYITTINAFLILLISGVFLINLFLYKYINILGMVINIFVIYIILMIIFSTVITYYVINDKNMMYD